MCAVSRTAVLPSGLPVPGVRRMCGGRFGFGLRQIRRWNCQRRKYWQCSQNSEREMKSQGFPLELGRVDHSTAEKVFVTCRKNEAGKGGQQAPILATNFKLRTRHWITSL